MSLEWFEHKGIRILLNDFRGLSDDAMIAQLDRTIEILRKEPAPVPMLVNLHGCVVSKPFFAAANQAGAVVKPLLTKQAILGIDVIKKLLLKSYNAVTKSNMRPFNSEQDAKDWLVSETN